MLARVINADNCVIMVRPDHALALSQHGRADENTTVRQEIVIHLQLITPAAAQSS